MPKGKKFNAAEEHFKKKEELLRGEIKRLRSETSSKNGLISELSEKCAKLEIENQGLKEWIERLLEYTELTPEEIAARVESDKKARKALDSLGFMADFLKGVF